MDQSLKLLPTEEELEVVLKKYFIESNYRKESVSKVFDARMKLDKESLERLNHQIELKFKTYTNAGYIVSCYIKTNDKQAYELSSWDDISGFDFAKISAITDKIVLKWNFNLKIPDSNVPIPHTLTLNISNGMKPEEMFKLIFSGSIDDGDDIEIAPYPIYAVVEFSNRILADELLRIVSQWIDDFDTTKNELNNAILWLKRRRQIVALSIKYLTSLVLYSTFFGMLHNVLISSKEVSIDYLQKIIYSLSAFIFVCSVNARWSTLVGGFFFNNLSAYGKMHSFALTTGDAKINKNENKNSKKIVKKLFFGIIFFIITTISTFFLEKILSAIFS